MRDINEHPPIGRRYECLSDDVILLIDGKQREGFYDHMEHTWYYFCSVKDRNGFSITDLRKAEYIDGWEYTHENDKT